MPTKKEEYINKIYFHTAEDMHEIPDEKARLIFVSPPYTNNSDGTTLKKKDYITFLDTLFKECKRILTPGGVIATLNTDLKDHNKYNEKEDVYNTVSKSFEGTVWLKHAVIENVAKDNGFKLHDYKIWNKRNTQDIFRFTFSHILFFNKPGGKVYIPPTQKHSEEYGPGIWHLEGGGYRKDSKGMIFRDAMHPEIPSRIIKQYSKENDLVVSPCAGSGTTLAIAHDLKRNWTGYETNKKLERLINESIYGPRPECYNQNR